jgi:hypothetical protein
VDANGKKSGGRAKGTPNRSTTVVKDFLERVFSRAFTEKRTIQVTSDYGRTVVEKELTLEDRLVDEIIRGTCSEAQFKTLLTYYAGRPVHTFDHSHKGKVTLEQLIAGTAPTDEDEG